MLQYGMVSQRFRRALGYITILGGANEHNGCMDSQHYRLYIDNHLGTMYLDYLFNAVLWL